MTVGQLLGTGLILAGAIMVGLSRSASRRWRRFAEAGTLGIGAGVLALVVGFFDRTNHSSWSTTIAAVGCGLVAGRIIRTRRRLHERR